MDVQALHQFLATVPGTFGDQLARRIAVDAIAAGSIDHAAALVGLVGPGVIGALAETGAPPAMLRAAINHAAIYRYRELPGLDRASFTSWCRQAEFAPPSGTPETIDIFRGTMGCSPAAAARGLHWSLSFDDAAFYACRYADPDLTGVIVVWASVSREDVAAWISGTAHSEVIPAEAPISFETITGHGWIRDAADRAARRLQELMAAGGWHETGTVGEAKQAAMAARARMTAAGVVPGTAIVPDGPALTGRPDTDAAIRAVWERKAQLRGGAAA